MQAIVIIVTLAIAKQITKRIDRLRSTGLKITLEVLLRIAMVVLSIYLKMKIMLFINGFILFFEIIGINIQLKEAKQRREEEEKSGVYTLSESEYQIID